jgi:abhydrolase domain-containing protein 12
VTPFRLETADGEKLYGWHVLPLALYNENELELAEKTTTGFVNSLPIKLLKEDPESRVVIFCGFSQIVPINSH